LKAVAQQLEQRHMNKFVPNDKSLIGAATPTTTPKPPYGERVLRKQEVEAFTGLSDDSIRRRERAGTFPRRIRLDPNAGQGGAVGWLWSEIERWLAERTAARDAVAGR
jgi:prophage regulatory protein